MNSKIFSNADLHKNKPKHFSDRHRLSAIALAVSGSLGGSLAGTAAAAASASGAEVGELVAATSATAATSVLEGVIVTGNRGYTRTVADSPAPIDVIGGDQIQKLGGNTALRDALAQLLPSFLTTTQSSLSADSIARPAGLRGLSGAHVLVLVNGKRRHNSAIVSLA